MTDEKLRLVKSLISSIPELTLGQIHWIQRVVSVFREEHQFTIYPLKNKHPLDFRGPSFGNINVLAT